MLIVIEYAALSENPSEYQFLIYIFYYASNVLWIYTNAN